PPGQAKLRVDLAAATAREVELIDDVLRSGGVIRVAGRELSQGGGGVTPVLSMRFFEGEHRRDAASALNELAPGNTYYTAGSKKRIESTGVTPPRRCSRCASSKVPSGFFHHSSVSR